MDFFFSEPGTIKKIENFKIENFDWENWKNIEEIGESMGNNIFLIKEICVLLYRRKDNIKFIQKSKKLYGTFGE